MLCYDEKGNSFTPGYWLGLGHLQRQAPKNNSDDDNDEKNLMIIMTQVTINSADDDYDAI